MNVKLYQLDKLLKRFLASFVFVLSVGVLIGLTYLNQTTNYSPSKTIDRFNGSEPTNKDDMLEIPETYPKPVSEMLITTHNHIIGFSLIFLGIGFIFYFNSVLGGFLKSFLMIEPLLSVLITFGSLWGMRYISQRFVYLAALSSTLIYLSYFTMAGIILYELLFKKEKSKNG